MEFNISDLLDELQEVDVNILPYANASENRIKELTMQKIQGKYEPRRRRRPIGRIFLIAAIVAMLAIPVMAVSGLLFTDWQEGIITPNENNGYDEDLLLGGASKIWDTSGWAVRISAENATSEGLTFVCEELGDPEKAGTLTTTEGYWLEKWDGSTYISMDAVYESDTEILIADSETARWDIRWTDLCGALESGSYRIGKHFTYTNPEGNTEELDYYAKFRIFSQDMDTYLKQYKTALNNLVEAENYHILETVYPDRQEGYAYYTKEIWKHDSDFLEEYRYVNEDGSLWGHRGYLYRGGKGYSLEWAGDDAMSGVADRESADYVDEKHIAGWHFSMDVIESILGQVYVDGNTLYFYEYSDWQDETYMSPEQIAEMNEEYPSWNHDYRERAYTLDENGNLLRIQNTELLSLDPETADPILDSSLDVFDTPAEEIVKVIEAQNVGGVRAFSWEADFAKFADTANTDGFVNTTAQPIATAEEAIARAKREADPRANPKYREGYDYNVSTAYFDEAAGMWKISFENSQDGIFLLYVYLDTEGVTQMTMYPYGDTAVTDTFIWEDLYAELVDLSVTEGFVNTEPQSILTAQDALDRARAESPPEANPNYKQSYIYDMVFVFRDPIAKMWKVDMFYTERPTFGCVVCMDDNGITKLVYYYPG